MLDTNFIGDLNEGPSLVFTSIMVEVVVGLIDASTAVGGRRGEATESSLSNGGGTKARQARVKGSGSKAEQVRQRGREGVAAPMAGWR